MSFKSVIRRKTEGLKRFIGGIKRKSSKYLEIITSKYGFAAVTAHALKNFISHGMTIYAGNFAYSAFLAMFPMILLIAAATGLVFNNNPEIMQKAMDALIEIFPGATDALEAMIESVVRLRSVVGAVGVLGLLWTVSKIAFAIQTGFEEVWEMRRRTFVKKKLFAMEIMLLLIVIGLLSLLATFLSSYLISWLEENVGTMVSTLSLFMKALFIPAASLVIFTVLYHAIPLGETKWKEVLWGALVASLLLYANHNLMSFYFRRISNAEALYGSMGVLLGIVLWLYLVGIIIFFGAEIVHSLQVRWEAQDEQENSEGCSLED